MKLLFASDIHGSALYCARLCERIEAEQPDKVILLGDLLYHGPRNDLPEGYAPKEVIPLLNHYKDNIVAVRGNCDSEVDQMVLEFPCMADYSIILADAGVELFVTHGHIWSPSSPPPFSDTAVFLFGHTHIKQAELIGDNLVVNPGSISLPKDGSRSYAVYEDKGFELKTLEGSSIRRIAASPR